MLDTSLKNFIYSINEIEFFAYSDDVVKKYQNELEAINIQIVDPNIEKNMIESILLILEKIKKQCPNKTLDPNDYIKKNGSAILFKDYKELYNNTINEIDDKLKKEFTESINNLKKIDRNNLKDYLCLHFLDTAVKKEIKKEVNKAIKQNGMVLPNLLKNDNDGNIERYCFFNKIPYHISPSRIYKWDCPNCNNNSILSIEYKKKDLFLHDKVCTCNVQIITEETYGPNTKIDVKLITESAVLAKKIYNSGIEEELLNAIVDKLDVKLKEVFTKYYIKNSSFKQTVTNKKEIINGNTYICYDKEGNGKGTVIYSDGSKYIGYLTNYKKTGFGEYHSAMFTYIGNFDDDCCSGEGYFEYNGNKYESKEWSGKFTSSSAIITYQNNSIYSGEVCLVNNECQKTGHGVYKCNEYTYEGNFNNDHESGIGVYHYKDGTEIKSSNWINSLSSDNVLIKNNIIEYHGPLLNGKKHGQGILDCIGKYTYNGKFSNDTEYGDGTYTFPNKTCISQNWKGNLTADIVKIIYTNGDMYEGTFEYGVCAGKVIRFIKNGKNGYTYSGNYKRDQPNGIGKYIFNNGDIYESDCWSSNLTSKNAHISYSNSTTYTGTLINGIKEGFGKLITKDHSYEGNFLRDQPHGAGKYYLKNGTEITSDSWSNGLNGPCKIYSPLSGEEFIGNIVDGKKTGIGKLIKYGNNGFVYEGEFLHNLPHGKGLLTQNNSTNEVFWKYGEIVSGVFCGHWKDGIYEGTWKNSKPCGYGKYEDYSGNKYEGEFYQGTFHGFGTYIGYKTYLEGYWEYDVFVDGKKKLSTDDYEETKCMLTLPNGDLFEGTWANNRPKNGILKNINGDVYTGTLNHDYKYDGRGHIIWANGGEWDGTWVNGEPFTGIGTIHTEDGWFEGEIYDQQKINHCTLYRGNGIIIEANFINDHMNLEKITYPDGSYYTGDFKPFERSGEGILIENNETVRYKGQFINNLLNGHGTMERKNTDGSWILEYDGEWKNGAKEGYGVEFKQDGTSYAGYWKNNKYHGNGIMYYPQLNGVKKGFWQNGKFIIHKFSKDDEQKKKKCYDSRINAPLRWNIYASIIPGSGQYARGLKVVGSLIFIIVVALIIAGVFNYNNSYVGFNLICAGILIHLISFFESIGHIKYLKI